MTILKLEMQPFTAAHLKALEDVHSSFLTGDTVPYQDLLKAAVICSRPPGKIGSFRGHRFNLKLKLWLHRIRKENWPAETVRMERHIYAGLKSLRDSIKAEIAASEAAI